MDAGELPPKSQDKSLIGGAHSFLPPLASLPDFIVHVGLHVRVNVGVSVGVSVGVNVGVDVEVGVDVGVDVGDGLGVAEAVDVGVAVGVAVGVLHLDDPSALSSAIGSDMTCNTSAIVGKCHRFSGAQGVCQIPTAPGSLFCYLHCCPACGGEKPSSAARCSLHAPPQERCRRFSSLHGTCGNPVAPGQLFCTLHYCPVCGGEKASSQKDCNMHCSTTKRCAWQDDIFGERCRWPALEGSPYCEEHEIPITVLAAQVPVALGLPQAVATGPRCCRCGQAVTGEELVDMMKAALVADPVAPVR